VSLVQPRRWQEIVGGGSSRFKVKKGNQAHPDKGPHQPTKQMLLAFFNSKDTIYLHSTYVQGHHHQCHLHCECTGQLHEAVWNSPWVINLIIMDIHICKLKEHVYFVWSST
jgi:hypothetical protein